MPRGWSHVQTLKGQTTMTASNSPMSQVQASRLGRSAITFFVQPESKASIRAALADGGYGTSFQQGIVSLLNELMVQQNREPIT